MLLCKIAYFDEDSAADSVRIIYGGDFATTIELFEWGIPIALLTSDSASNGNSDMLALVRVLAAGWSALCCGAPCNVLLSLANMRTSRNRI